MKVKTVKSIKYLPRIYWAAYYESENEFHQLLKNFEKRYGFYPQTLYYVEGSEKMLYVDLVDKLLPNQDTDWYKQIDPIMGDEN